LLKEIHSCKKNQHKCLTIILSKYQWIHASNTKHIEEIPRCWTDPTNKYKYSWKFFWSPVLNLVLVGLIYSSYLKFRCVEISGISK
jgi:hypothetical protein